MPMALSCAQPALLRHDDSQRFVNDFDFKHGALSGFNQRAALVAIGFNIGFNFTNNRALKRARLINQFF